jgi:predicted membrane-bound spermidine synthase
MINVLVKIAPGGTLEDAMTALNQAKIHYALNYKTVAKSGIMIVDKGKPYFSSESYQEAEDKK